MEVCPKNCLKELDGGSNRYPVIVCQAAVVSLLGNNAATGLEKQQAAGSIFEGFQQVPLSFSETFFHHIFQK